MLNKNRTFQCREKSGEHREEASLLAAIEAQRLREVAVLVHNYSGKRHKRCGHGGQQHEPGPSHQGFPTSQTGQQRFDTTQPVQRAGRRCCGPEPARADLPEVEPLAIGNRGQSLILGDCFLNRAGGAFDSLTLAQCCGGAACPIAPANGGVNTATAPTSCERCAGPITNAVVCSKIPIPIDYLIISCYAVCLIIRTCRWEKAELDRLQCQKNFVFNKIWNDNQYKTRQIKPIFKEEPDEIVVVTVYVYYF